MVLLMHYKHSALCLFLASIVIYFIVFLAPRNRALVFCTHLCLCFWLLFYGFEMRGYAEKSLHKRVYWGVLSTCIVGFLGYVCYLFTRKDYMIKKNSTNKNK